LYDVEAVPAAESEPALKEAQVILAGAGLSAVWVPCSAAISGARRCTKPLSGAELAVRMVTAPPRPLRARALPLGYSLVDARTQSGALATIYLDRVRWLAAAATTNSAALLGRAIAHEIGHLLLGTPQHGRVGVMREIWSRETMRSSRSDEWRFSVSEARQMLAAVLAREAGRREADEQGEREGSGGS
jgi:hypothetical protein